jgi:phosphoribosylamine--glycine ligase
MVFQAGTPLAGGGVVPWGGGILGAVGLGGTVAAATAAAYALTTSFWWPGVIYRRHIGGRAIARPRAAR